MLRESTKKWLLQEKELRRPKTLSERARLFRIRRTAAKAIEDLTFLLEHLNETELERIFNTENVSPLLRKLFSLESDEVEKRRKRVIGLWDAIFRVMNATYGLKLVGKEIWKALTIQRDANLRAIYYATMFHES